MTVARGDWIKMQATAASANSTTTQLVAVAGQPSLNDVFGSSGTIAWEYQFDDGAGHREISVGDVNLATLQVSNKRALSTYDIGATPKIKITGGAPLTSYSAAVTVSCGPSAQGMQPSRFAALSGLGDGVASFGDAESLGYAVGATNMSHGYLAFSPYKFTGTKSIKRATVRCVTAVAGASLLLGLYRLSDAGLATLIVDFTNGGAAAFDGTATGNKSNTSAGGAFTEFSLPPGDYLKGWQVLGADAAYLAGIGFSAENCMLGLSSGIPLSVIYKGVGTTVLPASMDLTSGFTGNNNVGATRNILLHLADK